MRFFRLFSFLLLPIRLARRLVAAIFGSAQVHWSPPAWPRAIARRPAVTIATILLLAGAGWGSAEWYRSREANRARPRELVATRKLEARVMEPAVPGWDQKLG